jgi:hypothetical protein
VADDRKERFAAFKAKFDSVSFLSRLSRLLRLGLRPGSALKFGLLTVTLTSMKREILLVAPSLVNRTMCQYRLNSYDFQENELKTKGRVLLSSGDPGAQAGRELLWRASDADDDRRHAAAEQVHRKQPAAP